MNKLAWKTKITNNSKMIKIRKKRKKTQLI